MCWPPVSRLDLCCGWCYSWASLPSFLLKPTGEPSLCGILRSSARACSACSASPPQLTPPKPSRGLFPENSSTKLLLFPNVTHPRSWRRPWVWWWPGSGVPKKSTRMWASGFQHSATDAGRLLAKLPRACSTRAPMGRLIVTPRGTRCSGRSPVVRCCFSGSVARIRRPGGACWPSQTITERRGAPRSDCRNRSTARCGTNRSCCPMGLCCVAAAPRTRAGECTSSGLGTLAARGNASAPFTTAARSVPSSPRCSPAPTAQFLRSVATRTEMDPSLRPRLRTVAGRGRNSSPLPCPTPTAALTV